MLRFAEDWETMNMDKLYSLGLDPDITWDPRILGRLLEIANGWQLFWVGKRWLDGRYDPRVLDRMLEIGSGEDLYASGRWWSDDRYDSRIAQALLDSKDMDYIGAVLGENKYYTPWKPERIRDLVMAWQGVGE